MDYLILGGYGFLGSRIVDYLKDKGNIVIGTSKKKFNNNDHKSIIGYRELNDMELDQLIKNFDFVFDASGISGPEIIKSNIETILNVNSIWPIRLSRSCIKNNCKLTTFSTYHCENIFINDQESLKQQIYPLSKTLAEISIMKLDGWKKNINIIRLGNMIGSPGKNFMGNSKLLPLDIARNLVMKGIANVYSNPSKEIGYIPIFKLFDSDIISLQGFNKFYSEDKISIFELSKQIKSCYEEMTGKEGNLIFKENLSDYQSCSISRDIILEIRSIINYFLKLKNSNKNLKTTLNE